ncbi:hypothetical protein GCM10010249_60080 [Streptomyces roseolilacinus]|uniref:Uncharacterized protein n=1 Tax=Streptomyces roseolilacinus TaxID=66904 RepID=A0A918EMJ7_9ACTN|nr:hypothetical protein GCM10010249_60080 [Streptomyces roseolilacinus]
MVTTSWTVMRTPLIQIIAWTTPSGEETVSTVDAGGCRGERVTTDCPCRLALSRQVGRVWDGPEMRFELGRSPGHSPDAEAAFI